MKKTESLKILMNPEILVSAKKKAKEISNPIKR